KFILIKICSGKKLNIKINPLVKNNAATTVVLIGFDIKSKSLLKKLSSNLNSPFKFIKSLLQLLIQLRNKLNQLHLIFLLIFYFYLFLYFLYRNYNHIKTQLKQKKTFPNLLI